MLCIVSIADMLTRIRNANNAKHETVDVPASNMKKSIADILVKEGYIKSYQVIEDGKQGIIRITLKYNGKQKTIQGLRRVSKPGLRIYSSCEDSQDPVLPYQQLWQISYRWFLHPGKHHSLLLPA